MSQREQDRTEQPRGRVLVVDDFPDGREMVAEILLLAGFEVTEAENGEKALGLAAEYLPDVVVTDLSLPDIDGFEISRRLRADSKTAGAKIVALTAHAGLSFEEQALEAGCDVFLVKPTPAKLLVSTIEDLLDPRPEPGPSPRESR